MSQPSKEDLKAVLSLKEKEVMFYNHSFSYPFHHFASPDAEIPCRRTHLQAFVCCRGKRLCFHVSSCTNTWTVSETPETVPKFQGVKLVPHQDYLTLRFLDTMKSRFQGPAWSCVVPGRQTKGQVRNRPGGCLEFFRSKITQT